MVQRLVLMAMAVMLWAAVPAQAADAPKEAPPAPVGAMKPGGKVKIDAAQAAAAMAGDSIDLRKIPLAMRLLQEGTEMYYVGIRSGLHGFLLYKDGQMQMMYITTDGEALVFGGMYGVDGTNISIQQVNNSSAENAQLKGLLTASAEQQKDLERSAGFGQINDSVSDAKKKLLPAGGGVTLTPGERLLNDFISATGVVVGEENKPILFMLVDPHCQFCKATWGELYEPLKQGQLRVKLIPIGTEGSENEKQAAKFLRIKDPMESWNKFVKGDKAILAGEPSTTDLAAVRANMAMVLEWKIQATPYLVYRGKDGKVKVVQGKPEKVAMVLADLKR